MAQNELASTNNKIEIQYLISTKKFIILSVLTFGIYDAWWMYKSWRFFQQKENTDLAPAIRAIFSIFFFVSLCNRVIEFAKEKNYKKDYSSSLLFIGYLFSVLLGFLPNPFYFLSCLSILFLIPPFEALGFAKRQSENITVIAQTEFNTRQLILLVVGSLFWLLLIYGAYLTLTSPYV